MTRFDENLCFIDLYTANKLNGWASDACTGIEVAVDNLIHLDEMESAFIKQVNRSTDRSGNTLSTQTIYEAYPQVFVWLELLDINVWIILILMVCVAGFTMISGLLIIILERTQMIGILKALGAGNKKSVILSSGSPCSSSDKVCSGVTCWASASFCYSNIQALSLWIPRPIMSVRHRWN
jgi:lipoprotein-releasing system permease protein